MALVFLLYALFATVFTVSKTGLQYTSPIFFVGSRMFIAGVLMLGYLYFFKRDKLLLKKEHFWGLFLLALFNIYLTNVLEFWGLQYLTSFKTCFIYSLSPFLSALLSYFVFSEKMNGKKWLGLAIGFMGFLPILMSQSSAEEGIQHLFFLSWAEIAVMLAAGCSVCGWVLLRQLVKDKGFTPLMANGGSMFIGGVMALFHSFCVEAWDPIPVTEMMPFVECSVWLIVISNFVCYNLYGLLLKRFTATFISFAGFTTPLFAAIFGWYYLGEEVSLPFYFSAAIVFIGLLVFNQEELKQGYAAPVKA